MIRLSNIVVKFGDFTALHDINVHVKDKHALEGNAEIAAAVAAVEADLAGNGRVLIRPSGTEPVVRVMVEASDAAAAENAAKAIAEVVERVL